MTSGDRVSKTVALDLAHTNEPNHVAVSVEAALATQLAMVQSMIAYNYSVTRKIWECIETLTDEQFVQEVNYSIGSIRNHMIHLAGVDQRWISRVIGEPVPDRIPFDKYSTKADVRALYNRVEAHVLIYVEGMNPTHLADVIQYTSTRVSPPQTINATMTIWQILMHMVNHGTDHRAQVLRVLHSLGAPTLEQDYALYVWDNPIR